MDAPASTPPPPVPPPRPVEAVPGTPWSDLALLGWARWFTVVLASLTLLMAFVAPFTGSPTADWLVVVAAFCWRAGIGAIIGCVALAFALWRRRWTGWGTWAGFLPVMLLIILVAEAVALVAVAFATSIASGQTAAENAQEGMQSAQFVVQGALLDNLGLVVALILMGLCSAVIVFALYAGHRARPWVSHPAVWTVGLVLLVRPLVWMAVVATFGLRELAATDAYALGLALTAVHLCGLVPAAALARPARRALTASRGA